MELSLEGRLGALEARLQELGSLLVAFSGGVDSALLAVVAHRVLGASALAVTADSPSLADEQRQRALALAAQFGFAHRVVATDEFQNPLYVANGPDRCYHCKRELFDKLQPLAQAVGLAHVGYGLIVDDLSDFRPGQRAAREARAVAPLCEAGLTKADVRALSRELGLPTWDLPASPCLSSRLPYGTPVSVAALRQVERAEAALRALGLRELRVRHLGERARLELGPDELGLAQGQLCEAVRAAVLAAGYTGVELDPRGYRRGSLNEGLGIGTGI